MAEIRPRDLLSVSLLNCLGATEPCGPAQVAADIGTLCDVGYLKIALPPEFGGLGCTLRQAACGQRRLARHAPAAALAVSAHLYWTGAAADAYRAGDESVRWILAEAARGALFGGGHAQTPGDAGADLRFADPRSRVEPAAEGGYQFADPGVLATVTPGWDWLAVHGVHQGTRARSVVAFAGRGTRCTPAFRVVRVEPAGNPSDIFATSALTWGHAILASVLYSDTRRAFNAAVAALAATAASATGVAGVAPPGTGNPLDGWAVAEAGLRLDTMKSKIAAISHPWPLVPCAAPDLGGQHLISLYAMRHEVDEGAARVHELISEFGGSPVTAAH
jgi:alkylation response protein AidB-like acyl-CoA dehydrogenase